MKFFLTPQVYDALPAARRCKLVALLNLLVAFSRTAGECMVGQSTLAEKLGQSVPTIRRLERQLERLELIACDHHRRGNRRAIRVLWDRGPLAATSRRSFSTPDAGPLFAAGCAIKRPRTVENRDRGTRAHSEPSRKNESERQVRHELAGGLLARAFRRLVDGTGLWARSRRKAWDLAVRIADDRGHRKAAAWLDWLTWHNGRAFSDVRRRGAATWGALCKAAGLPRTRQRERERGPAALGALLPFALAELRP